MCPSISLNVLSSDQWNAYAYSAVSVTYRVSAAVQKRAAAAVIATSLWRLDRLVSKLLATLYSSVENAPSNPNPDPITPEQVSSAVQTLRKLHATVESLYSRIQSSGLIHSPLVGASASSLRAHADEILEIAEWLELTQDSSGADGIFEESLAEFRRGEVFDLDSIR